MLSEVETLTPRNTFRRIETNSQSFGRIFGSKSVQNLSICSTELLNHVLDTFVLKVGFFDSNRAADCSRTKINPQAFQLPWKISRNTSDSSCKMQANLIELWQAGPVGLFALSRHVEDPFRCVV